MQLEIDQAAALITKLILPQSSIATDIVGLQTQRAQTALCTAIAQQLHKRYSGHWYPTSPVKGSGYRAVTSTPGAPDALLLKACRSALPNLTDDQVSDLFVTHFTVYCDPGVVEVALGESGHPWTHWQVDALEAPSTSGSSDIETSSSELDSTTICPTHIHRKGSPRLSPTAAVFTPISASKSNKSSVLLGTPKSPASVQKSSPRRRRRRRQPAPRPAM